MWRFRVHGRNVADLRSCPWCCVRYCPKCCAPDARGRVSSLSQAPLRSSTLPRASGAQHLRRLLWWTGVGDGCWGNPPPRWAMLPGAGLPCSLAVSLRLRHHPARRPSVLRWSPVLLWSPVGGVFLVVRPVLVYARLRNLGRVRGGFRLPLRREWGVLRLCCLCLLRNLGRLWCGFCPLFTAGKGGVGNGIVSCGGLSLA